MTVIRSFATGLCTIQPFDKARRKLSDSEGNGGTSPLGGAGSLIHSGGGLDTEAGCGKQPQLAPSL